MDINLPVAPVGLLEVVKMPYLEVEFDDSIYRVASDLITELGDHDEEKVDFVTELAKITYKMSPNSLQLAEILDHYNAPVMGKKKLTLAGYESFAISDSQCALYKKGEYLRTAVHDGSAWVIGTGYQLFPEDMESIKKAIELKNIFLCGYGYHTQITHTGPIADLAYSSVRESLAKRHDQLQAENKSLYAKLCDQHRQMLKLSAEVYGKDSDMYVLLSSRHPSPPPTSLGRSFGAIMRAWRDYETKTKSQPKSNYYGGGTWVSR